MFTGLVFSLFFLAHSAELQLRFILNGVCMFIELVEDLRASIKYFSSFILIHFTGTVLCYDAKRDFKN